MADPSPLDSLGENLIVLTPLKHDERDNVFRIDRLNLSSDEVPRDVLHVAGGQHSGIVIRKMEDNKGSAVFAASRGSPNLTLDFNVFLNDSSDSCLKLENRSLKFYYDSKLREAEKHFYTQEFFKCLLNEFPKDYLNFVKKLLKLMQTGFEGLKTIQVDMKLKEGTVTLPRESELDTSIESEVVTPQRVKEVLEHAYPNGMMAESLAHALLCPMEEIYEYLEELQAKNLVSQLENGQWIRVDTISDFEKTIVKQMPKVYDLEQPTVAIITALYVEKLAVDAVVENKKTFVRYKTDGESNIYTLGNIGPHRVVSTKLSAVGCTRSASIAAGSITTRLLGCFQEVQHVLVVGVGGGVPHLTDKEENVRLGDVVVSEPVEIDGTTKNRPLSYIFTDPLLSVEDNNTIKANGYVIKGWSPNDPILSETAHRLKIDVENERSPTWRTALEEALNYLTSKTEQLAPNNDSADKEELADGKKKPKHHHTSCSTFCRPPASSDCLTVRLGGHGTGERLAATLQHPDAERSWSRIHVGGCVAACGGGKSRDYESRADFAGKFRVKAFDVDFQTVVESILGNRINSWAMIRGVCDYGDGTKNKDDWQPYAALQAAVVAKMIVALLPEYKVDDEDTEETPLVANGHKTGGH